jgi:hypothetical protein
MEQSKTPGRKPSHRIYRVAGEGEKAIWTPIGAAWPNRTGDGFTLSYDAVPVTGRIVMQPIKDQPKAGGQQ